MLNKSTIPRAEVHGAAARALTDTGGCRGLSSFQRPGGLSGFCIHEGDGGGGFGGG